jgi:drug/metabolite transporter (DMT)-like permease
MLQSNPHHRATSIGAASLGLYAAIVFIWGTSWIALTAQLGVVPPEISVFWRFALAGAMMWLYVAATRQPMGFPPGDHLRLAGTGVFLFSSNFLLFYYGGLAIPSGLLAVVFSLASVINLALGALVLKAPIEPRVAAGGVVGALGIALLFWPQIAGAEVGRAALVGLAQCVAGTLSFCLGNLVSTSIQRRGIPLASATTWGMTYGSIFLVLLCLFRGHSFAIEWTPTYLGALAYLAVVCSVMAFATYLTLLRRIGPARAGYATVMFPIVALAVSTLFEGYRWTLLSAAGALLALLGNTLVLGTRRAPETRTTER